MNEMKQWRCLKCDLPLGQVKRNGRGIRQLGLYRDPVLALEVVAPAEADVIGFPEGTMRDIRCPRCGALRTWYAGHEAYARREPQLYHAE